MRTLFLLNRRAFLFNCRTLLITSRGQIYRARGEGSNVLGHRTIDLLSSSNSLIRATHCRFCSRMRLFFTHTLAGHWVCISTFGLLGGFYMLDRHNLYRFIIIFISVIPNADAILNTVRKTRFCSLQGKCRSVSKSLVIVIWNSLLEDDRHMGVPHKAKAAIEMVETAFCQHLGSEIFPEWSIGAAVHQCAITDFQAFWSI